MAQSRVKRSTPQPNPFAFTGLPAKEVGAMVARGMFARGDGQAVLLAVGRALQAQTTDENWGFLMAVADRLKD